MDERVRKFGVKSAKITGALCMATGVVVLGSLVASGAAVGAVVEGFKSAKNTMKKILKEEQDNEIVVESNESETNTEMMGSISN